MKKELLFFGFNDERKQKLIQIAQEFEIETKEILQTDLGQKVGFLFALEGYERQEAKEEKIEGVEFIIFSDFDRDELRNYLVKLKENEIVVPYKSVITETSKDWTISYLIDHIKDEHEVVNMYNELGKLIKEAQTQLDKNHDAKLNDALEYALSIREINGVEKEDILPRYKRLKEAMNG